jgi:hypothetical protein
LAELFIGVLRLCREAGLVKVGVVAIDGTMISANAGRDANESYRPIVHEILEQPRRSTELKTSSTVSSGVMRCRRRCGPWTGAVRRSAQRRSDSTATPATAATAAAGTAMSGVGCT